MLYEPTTLASSSALLATSLREEYGIDPVPIFFQADLPMARPESPLLRYPLKKVRELWALSREATGDPAVGLKTGKYAQPRHFYAFGYSWSASANLLGAFERLSRYYKVMSTASVTISLHETRDSYVLSAAFPDKTKMPPKEGIDCGMTALLAMCDIVANKEIRPTLVELAREPDELADVYSEALRAPIQWGTEVGAFYFDKKELLVPLPLSAPDIAKATDKIAEQYIETLDPHKVASEVRRLLIDLLPSGKADQERISRHLNRSASTLQRQLQAEGLTYRQVLESTQRNLAETYLREKKHTHAQIAYLLGFSEQSNFSRAFKRWTSMTPRQFQARQ